MFLDFAATYSSLIFASFAFQLFLEPRHLKLYL